MALIAVPNFSAGRSRPTIAAIAAALGQSAAVLDIHSDVDHNRTVFTLAGTPGQLSDAVLAGAGVALLLIDMSTHDGVHPHVGALDVAPFVYTEDTDRGRAAAAALLTADRLAHELDIPVFLYGSLSPRGMTRAHLRRGGPDALAARMATGELTADFGPNSPHPGAGATLVAARAPLIAFNIELAPPADLAAARCIAAEIRQLPGVRAIGVELSGARAQVSTNLEAPDRTSPAAVLAAVSRRASVVAAELVGLPPERYLEDFPAGVVLRNRRTLEERLP